MNSANATESQFGVKTAWKEFRQQMPVTKKWAYFDHAAVAPIPKICAESISHWARQAAEEGDIVWSSWSSQHESLRSLMADSINALPEEISMIPNTTFGINLVAGGLDWRPGDNVVLPSGEFPSNIYPWMNLQSRGVEVRIVKLDGHRVCADRLANACDHRTRIISASWVGYASGYRLDPSELAQVAHDRGAMFFLDAIQALGVFPLDVRQTQIDFLAADGHKWLLGPEGAGVFYIRRDLLPKLLPMNVGWNSVIQGNDFNKIDWRVRDSAARYEGGSQNMAGFIGLLASAKLLVQFGWGSQKSEIGQQVIDITDRICQALRSVGARIHSLRGNDCSSGIISFEMPGRSADDVRNQLLASGVVVSCRGGHLRASAHCYNDENDIDRLTESLKAVR